MLPLEGIKVLDLTRLVPGPFATMILADFGADVVKIEPPGAGDYAREFEPKMKRESAIFYAFNRNKKSIVLNLKDEKDKKHFLNMVKSADVLIESFRVGVMDRLGLGYETLKKINSGLIYCTITGFGEGSPYEHMPGHDINFVGMGGILDLTGTKETPVPLGTQLADLGSGLWAVIGILLALRKRELTGEGDYIEISMLDTVINWLHIPLAEYIATGRIPKRGETWTTGKYPSYSIYRTKDGFITVAGLEEKFWIDICKALGREDLIPHQNNPDPWVKKELEKEFSKKTNKEWMEIAVKNGLCMMPVYSVKNVMEDLHTKKRNLLWEIEIPEEGVFPTIAPAIKFKRTKMKKPTPPPKMGEHQDQ